MNELLLEIHITRKVTLSPRILITEELSCKLCFEFKFLNRVWLFFVLACTIITVFMLLTRWRRVRQPRRAYGFYFRRHTASFFQISKARKPGNQDTDNDLYKAGCQNVVWSRFWESLSSAANESVVLKWHQFNIDPVQYLQLFRWGKEGRRFVHTALERYCRQCFASQQALKRIIIYTSYITY